MRSKKLRFGTGFKVIFSNERAQVAQMVIPPGDAEGDRSNRHRGADQWLYVVDGVGTAWVNGKTTRLSRGVLLLIERNDRHEIKNVGRAPLKTLNYYVPPAYTAAGEERPAARRR